MNWTEYLNSEVEDVFHATEGLFDLVDDSMLDWKPETGENWLTVGKLLMHIGWACGCCMKGFVTGDWSTPEDAAQEESEEGQEGMLTALQMPSIESVAKAKEMLAADKALAFEMIEKAGEEDLANKEVAAPWNPEVTFPLGRHLHHMITHLNQHKGQLFYYLKLMGKPVHTGTLWGM
jgi:uncharacterized damage-inducible protein DinB